MEESVPLSGAAVPRGVRIGRSIAAVLLSLELMWMIVNDFTLTLFNDFIPIHVNVYPIAAITMLLACFILFRVASNRATKTMMLLMCCWMALRIILLASVDMLALFTLPNPVVIGYESLHTMLWVFCLGVIVQNNRLRTDSVVWVGILCVHFSVRLIFGFSEFWMQGADFGEIYSRLYSLFWDVFYVLMIVAWFRFSRCGAFAGNCAGSPAPQGAYSPLNRYVAALFLTLCVVGAALWAYFQYAAPMLRQL